MAYCLKNDATSYKFNNKRSSRLVLEEEDEDEESLNPIFYTKNNNTNANNHTDYDRFLHTYSSHCYAGTLRNSGMGLPAPAPGDLLARRMSGNEVGTSSIVNTAAAAAPSAASLYRRSKISPASRFHSRNQHRQPASSHSILAARLIANNRSPPSPENLYQTLSGPAKRPAPLYKKKRDMRIPTTSTSTQQPHPDYADLSQLRPLPATVRLSNDGRRRANQKGFGVTNSNILPLIYPYSTYPPSALQYPQPCLTEAARKLKSVGVYRNAQPHEEFIQERYPILARIAIKFAQFALGAAIILLVYGPIRGNSYYRFVLQTQTEWQGLVIGVVTVFMCFSLFLLLTICLANINFLWRQIDSIVSGFGAFLYLFTTILEGYYAICYPPYGERINLVCYRTEWIIATGFSFFNTVFYITDLILILRTGVSVL